jgi:serine/threonine protein kinase
MEYVDGRTITQLVNKHGRFPLDDAAHVMRQVADALAAAHAAGIVHRDVKPSNVLVDRRGFAKLADFGIARITNDPSLTQTGMVTGSPAYLAPEVAAGRRADERSDVWSFGATLFHMLAGRPPYDIGDQVLGGLYRIVNEEPPRLGEAGRLAPLLEGTMVKDPSDRWSMAQVRDFLDGSPAPDGDHTRVLAPTPRVEEPAPAAAGPVPARTREAKSGMTNKVMVAALVAVLAVVLVLGALLATRGLHNNGRNNTPAASPPSKSASGPSTKHSPSVKHGPHKKAKPAPATAAGMQAFVRQYVSAVAANPDGAWPMLTPKFQRESGGLAKYRRFWSGVGNAHVGDIVADPRSMIVSYHVRFDNFGSGKRPTVLKLVHRHGHYLIDGEQTKG